MAVLARRTRGRVLTIFTVLALIFAMGGAAPAQEKEPGEEPAEPGIVPAADLDVTGDLTVQGDVHIGYGTGTPGTGFELEVEHIGGNWVEIRLDNGTPGNSGTWDLQSSTITDDFSIWDTGGAFEPFVIEQGAPVPLIIDSLGGVGIGIANPVGQLDVRGGLITTGAGTGSDYYFMGQSGQVFVLSHNTNLAQFTVHEDAPFGAFGVGDTANTSLQPLRVSANVGSGVTPSYVLENNGAPLFFYKNTATGDEFQFSLLSNGEFVISALGTGGPEFVVSPNGTVRMGPGPSNTFVLDPAGNLTITGNLTTAGGTLSATDWQADAEALRTANQALEARVAALEALISSSTG